MTHEFYAISHKRLNLSAKTNEPLVCYRTKFGSIFAQTTIGKREEFPLPEISNSDQTLSELGQQIWPIIFLGENASGESEMIAAILPFEERFLEEAYDHDMGLELLEDDGFSALSARSLCPQFHHVERLLPLCSSIIWHPDLLDEGYEAGDQEPPEPDDPMAGVDPFITSAPQNTAHIDQLLEDS